MESAIRAAAGRFRAAFDEGGLSHAGFQRFPRGACGDASELLGEYLRNCGLGEWTYCSGISPPDGDMFQSSHGWLERDGVIVDITADQFATGQPAVVVTRDPSWYATFQRLGGARRAGLDYYDTGTWGAPLRADYETLKARADKLATEGDCVDPVGVDAS